MFRTQNLSYLDRMFIVIYREVYAHECRAQSYKGRGVDMAALQGLIFSTQSYKGRGIESTALYYARA